MDGTFNFANYNRGKILILIMLHNLTQSLQNFMKNTFLDMPMLDNALGQNLANSGSYPILKSAISGNTSKIGCFCATQ
jgi:hypothetical protein